MAPPDSHDLAVFPDTLRDKRILLCTESFGPVNGVSNTTLRLVTHLRAQGAVVAVVAPENHTGHNTFIPNKSSTATDARATGNSCSNGAAKKVKGQAYPPQLLPPPPPDDLEVRVRGHPVPYNPELSIAYPVRLSSLYRQTFGGPPDLIYLASPASLGFQVMLQLQQQPRRCQVPVLANFQTDLAGYCTIMFPPPLNYIAVFCFGTVQRFLFSHPSVRTLFYPSRFVGRYLEASGIPGEKMVILQRGVDTQLFQPSRRNLSLRESLEAVHHHAQGAALSVPSTPPRAPLHLITVARLAPEKGFPFLAAAAEQLDARGDVDFVLHVVGGNRNAAVDADIRALFAKLEARGRVVFAGQRVGEDLARAYASADLFLHCSVTETFGLVVLEAMASGLPVVARDEGGPSDTVRHGESGFLVPSHDLDGFVERVALLARDVDMRRRFALAARTLAEGATWDKINNKVAWRMADTLEELGQEQDREREKARAGGRSKWLIRTARESVHARMVHVKLLGAMAAVGFFWAVIAVYLGFIAARMRAKRAIKE